MNINRLSPPSSPPPRDQKDRKKTFKFLTDRKGSRIYIYDQNFLSKLMTNHAEKTAVVESDSSNGGRVGRGERLVATEEGSF